MTSIYRESPWNLFQYKGAVSHSHEKSHCGDKMVLSPQWDFLYSYWNTPQGLTELTSIRHECATLVAEWCLIDSETIFFPIWDPSFIQSLSCRFHLRKHKNISTSQRAKPLRSPLIRYPSNVKVSERRLINGNPMVFAIWEFLSFPGMDIVQMNEALSFERQEHIYSVDSVPLMLMTSGPFY